MIQRTPVRIFDTSALLAYAHQTSPKIAVTLASTAAHPYSVLVPLTCVAEAYAAASADTALYLDLLMSMEQIEASPLDELEDAVKIGGVAKHTWRLGLAHACFLTLATRLPLMTGDAATAMKILGDDSLVWDV